MIKSNNINQQIDSAELAKLAGSVPINLESIEPIEPSNIPSPKLNYQHLNLVEPDKPTVICLSGKRFSGKGEVSKLLAQFIENVGCTVKITCLSYHLKKAFCDMNSIDFERFMTDHEFKNSHRKALTEYFLTKNPIEFSDMLISEIDEGKFDMYIVDDMRLLEENAIYFKTRRANAWDLVYVRVNATLQSRESRGWKYDPEYDDLNIETDLDYYDDFNFTIENNGSIRDLSLSLKAIKQYLRPPIDD